MIRIMAAGLALAVAGIASAQPAQSWEPYSAGLQARATAGDAGAQFALGEAYRTGNGIGSDREQAIGWYRRAAATDTRAADALGVLLFTKGERRQAIPLLQAAAGRRNAYALYILGTARFNGDFVPKDLPRAFADMRLAAATLPQAQRSLAIMEPYVGPADRTQADVLVAQARGPEAGAPAAPAYVTAAPPPRSFTPPPPPQPRRAAAPPPPTAALTPPPAAAPNLVQKTVPSSPKLSAKRAPLATDAGDEPVPLRARPIRPVSTAGSWRVQLGAYGTEARAAQQWSILATKVPALAGLRRTTEAAGTLVRLQATGLPSREAAATLCRDVADAGAGCFVVGQ